MKRAPFPWYALLRCLVLAAFAVSAAPARVVGVEVASRSDVLDGKAFGLAGPYEKLIGTVRLALDPTNEANQIITDIELAPRNARGEVEFSADLYILKPKEISRGNGAVLLEINNRGRKGMLGMFSRASGSLDPTAAQEFGDGFLLQRGFTLVWVGWQFDPPMTPGLMHVFPPRAGSAENPVRGLVRSNFVVTDRTFEHTLADRDHQPYPVADPDAPESRMTVRQRIDDRPVEVPRSKWRFAHMENGQPVADTGKVWLEGGFEPGKIYEVVYVSENPQVVGAGSAAVRDVLSQLKYEGSNELGMPRGSIDRVLGFGTSQSGRYLRTFLYYGFNRDESDRKVFDGVMPHVAGGGRGSFNHRFAQASRDAHPFVNFFYPTDIFPFSDVEQTDPETGLSDGLLAHLKPQHRPKIFYTNSAYEYWGRAASLIHTTIDGKADVALPDTTRIYFVAGTQHGPSGFPPSTGIGQQRNNPLDYRWAMRALLVALDRWVADGVEPPPSRYPHIADGTLVTPEKLGFPKIPGVNYSTRLHKAYRADYGPKFYSDGIVSNQPPKIGSAFPMLVPAVDADGNETSGIRLPELRAPLATYTGWNLFNPKAGPEDEISSMAGSYIPLARTAAQRKKAGDPRLSIEERYASREAYLGEVSEAALELAGDRYLLEEDVAEVLRRAAGHWDHLMSENPGPSGGL